MTSAAGAEEVKAPVSGEQEPAVRAVAAEPWAGGDRRLHITIRPTRITGRRIRHR